MRRNSRRFAIAALCLPLAAAAQIDVREHIIFSKDGTALTARSFVPAACSATAPCPGLVIDHGGALGNKERTYLDGVRYAEAGFVALTYTARGYAGSGGISSVVGWPERRDQKSVIDWMIEELPVDPDRLGATGISAGAEHSYMAWVEDPRIRTAVPMQGWRSLYDVTFPGGVGAMLFGSVLYSAQMVGTQGRTDPIVHSWYATGVTEADPADAEHAMVNPRSWGLRIGEVTDPKKSIFIVHSFPDQIVPGEHGIVMFESIAPGVQGKLLMTNDIHSGVANNAHVRAEALAWFRCMLIGDGDETVPECDGVLDPNDGSVVDPVQLTVIGGGPRRSGSAFPHGTPTPLSLCGGGVLAAGAESCSAGDAEIVNLPGSDARFSRAVTAATEVIGIPTVTVSFRAPDPGDPLLPVRRKIQLNARLFDVPPDGLETEITRGVVGLRNIDGGSDPIEATIRMRAAAYRIEAGHTLELRISNQNMPTYAAWREPGVTEILLGGTSLVALPLSAPPAP